MADFKTHVTFSSAIGAGYAVVAKGMGFDLSTAILATVAVRLVDQISGAKPDTPEPHP